jgi:hypothetical protein
MPATSWIRRCKIVPLPGSVYRVTDWHRPFDPPPPSPAISDQTPEDPPAGRWDDPDGVFRTLYCATLPEGAIGGKLGDFALNPPAAVRIEAFLESDPDDEFIDDQLLRPLDRADIESFNWTLASAPTQPGAKSLDVNHSKTHSATLPAVGRLLVQFGLRAFDRRAILDERRNFTRRLARIWRSAATSESGELLIHGLRFRSRHPPAWMCWALWEPLPLDIANVSKEPLTIYHPALRAAARKLGIELAE